MARLKKRLTKRTSKKSTNKISGELTEMNCKKCDRLVYNVDSNAISVLCTRCTTLLVGAPKEKIQRVKSNKPRGWAFLAKYIHEDGTVYFRGVEQPKLKDTLKPTDLKKLGEKRKKTSEKNKKIKEERKIKREKQLVKEHKKRASIKEKKRKEKIKMLKG